MNELYINDKKIKCPIDVNELQEKLDSLIVYARLTGYILTKWNLPLILKTTRYSFVKEGEKECGFGFIFNSDNDIVKIIDFNYTLDDEEQEDYYFPYEIDHTTSIINEIDKMISLL